MDIFNAKRRTAGLHFAFLKNVTVSFIRANIQKGACASFLKNCPSGSERLIEPPCLSVHLHKLTVNFTTKWRRWGRKINFRPSVGAKVAVSDAAAVRDRERELESRLTLDNRDVQFWCIMHFKWDSTQVMHINLFESANVWLIYEVLWFHYAKVWDLSVENVFLWRITVM